MPWLVERQGRRGFAVLLDGEGALAFRAGDETVSTSVPMLAGGHWYQVVASVDLDPSTVCLVQRPLRA